MKAIDNEDNSITHPTVVSLVHRESIEKTRLISKL